MVRQYDTSTGPNRYSHLYTLFRYQSGGETQTVAELAVHEDTGEGGGVSAVYQIDGTEVRQAAFEEAFYDLVTSRLLERSSWMPVSGRDP